jgi:hypothetical protein
MFQIARDPFWVRASAKSVQGIRRPGPRAERLKLQRPGIIMHECHFASSPETFENPAHVNEGVSSLYRDPFFRDSCRSSERR